MIVTLTQEIEAALATLAARRGVTPDNLANQLLAERLHDLNGNGYLTANDEKPNDVLTGKTLYDQLKDYIGIVDSSEFVPGGANFSQDCGRKFTEGLLEKRRLGKL